MDHQRAMEFAGLVSRLRGDLTSRAAHKASGIAATTWKRWEDAASMVGKTPNAAMLRKLARYAAKMGADVSEREIFEAAGRTWFPDQTDVPDDDDDLLAELAEVRDDISRLLDEKIAQVIARQKGRR